MHCRNCGAVTEGPFCAACGQETAAPDSLMVLAAEWYERTFGRDAILWSTLVRLILRPGGLTRDWWEGRRGGVMSPVRTVLVVLFLGTALATLEHLVVGRAELDVGKMIAAFTYQLIGIGALVCLSALPRLLPRAARRTAYEIAVFALYEAAFLGLLVAFAFVVLILTGWLPPILAVLLGGLAPFMIPGLLVVMIGHPALHLRQAFSLSWPGAVARILALAPPIAVGMLVANVVFAATGLDAYWTPQPRDGFGEFHRVEPEAR